MNSKVTQDTKTAVFVWKKVVRTFLPIGAEPEAELFLAQKALIESYN